MLLSNDSSQLSYLGKIINESMQLPVFYKMVSELDENFYWSSSVTGHPFLREPTEFIRSVASQGEKLTGPVIHETNYFEQFAVVPVKQGGKCQAVFVIGPATRQRANSPIYTEFLNEHGIPVQERQKWMDYWNGLQTIDLLRFLNICISVNWMVNQEALDVTDVFQSSLEYGLPGKQKETELELSVWRETSFFQDGIIAAQPLLGFIRNGDKQELMRQLLKFMKMNSPITVKNERSHLRNVKNLAICGVALSSNAAVQGGVYEGVASPLSDMYIRRIEESNKLALVEATVLDAIVDFTDRVNEYKNNGLSKVVRISKEYIYHHLYEDIKLHHLVDVSGVNPNYLSQLFKKETGLSLMNFIQKEKIEEAKKLLDHSNDTISIISGRLNFYDQAYFVKVFKKHTGITPKQFRNR